MLAEAVFSALKDQRAKGGGIKAMTLYGGGPLLEENKAASHAKNRHGSFFREYCGEIKEIIEYVASRAIGRKLEETKQEELSISRFGPFSRLTELERNTIMTTASSKAILETFSRTEILLKMEDDEKEKTAG